MTEAIVKISSTTGKKLFKSMYTCTQAKQPRAEKITIVGICMNTKEQFQEDGVQSLNYIQITNKIDSFTKHIDPNKEQD